MPKLNRKKLILIFLVLIGLLLSFLLLFQHYRHLKDGFGEKSFCTVSELVNCDAVDASDYSDLYGVPVAGLGFLYYLILLFYLIRMPFPSGESKEKSLFCFLLTVVACLVSLAMAYFSAFEVGVMCLLCAGLYLVNFSLLLFMPRFLDMKWKELPLFLQAFKGRFLLQNITSFLVMAVGAFIFYEIGELTQYNSYDSAPVHIIHPDQHPFLGNPNANVIIVEFGDFECQFCREFHEIFQPIFEIHKTEVAFYFINYPLDTTCNTDLKKQVHPNACQLARIGICAQQKQVFWPYHNFIFENQLKLDKLKESQFLEIVESIGLDSDWISTCVDSQETKVTIQKNMELAKSLDVRGTPSIFINGKLLRNWHNENLLNKIISEEAKK